ncbi:MAG: rubrerythrin [Deltaproteobacteria bacterium]|jgi:rubrerythrin
MQEFIDHLLEGLDLERKLTDEEMTRVIRFMLAFEEEAFQLYTHLMSSTDNGKVRAVFKEIADDKRFQVTQLIRLLGQLNTCQKRLH